VTPLVFRPGKAARTESAAAWEVVWVHTGMKERLIKFTQEAQKRIALAGGSEDLEQLRIELLGRKSFLSEVSSAMRALSGQERAEVGKLLNDAKRTIADLLAKKQENAGASAGGSSFDPTIPFPVQPNGSIHPVSAMIASICAVFKELRFMIYEGNEIEDEYHNFEALNIAKDHPSREDFDTFFLQLPEGPRGKYLLRSHTSPSQIRVMQKHKPPFAFIVPGKVYRPDAVDASHSYVFHQIEGFAVDTAINFSHLKGILYHFAQKTFGSDVALRFRPSFFPFTEPSAEVDISCIVCKGKGCSLCSRKGWLEVLGCGMIHPHVLSSCNVDPTRYQGFAFGMGVERIALLKLGIPDIRLLFENDERFLKQFYEI